MSPVPPAPWTCRVEAVIRFAVRPRPVLLAVVDYLDTPVGPYHEALLAHVRGPLVTVPWIVVDSVASLEAGQALWNLPKQLGALAIAPGLRSASVTAGPVRMEVSARPLRVRLPALLPGWLEQPGRPRAPLRFTGRMRPALVQVSGTLPGGLTPAAGPGALLEGELRLGAAT